MSDPIDGVELYNRFLDILISGDISQVEQYLSTANATSMSITLCLEILMATCRMPRDKMPSRPVFYTLVKSRMESEFGLDEANAAMSSLI